MITLLSRALAVHLSRHFFCLRIDQLIEPFFPFLFQILAILGIFNKIEGRKIYCAICYNCCNFKELKIKTFRALQVSAQSNFDGKVKNLKFSRAGNNIVR